MTARYRYGDLVTVNGAKAKVISVWCNISGDYSCRVRFDDGSEAEYPEKYIQPQRSSFTGNSVKKVRDDIDRLHNMRYNTGGYNKKDNDKTCPLCGSPWNIMPSPFHGDRGLWYDCLPCSKTRDQIKKELEDGDEF